MLQFQILKKVMVLSVCVLSIYFVRDTYSQSENITSLKQINPDKACGPRCLSAFMKITGIGKPECDIKCIYEMIGKEPFKAANLKELKDAAGQLGFAAIGYKISVKELKKLNNYAILPIGTMRGTFDNPLHFILFKEVRDDYAIIIDTKTLESEALPLSELQTVWNGIAIVISPATCNQKPSCKVNYKTREAREIPVCGNDYSISLGVVDSGTKVEHTFIISESTKDISEAKIVSKSCSCLDANLGRTTDGKITLTLKLKVDRPSWQEANAGVLLKPLDIVRRYTIKAYGKSTYQISPSIGYIEAPNGGTVEYPVTIDYYTDTNDIVEFSRIDTLNKDFSIGKVTTKVSAENQFKTFTFQVPLIFDAGKNPQSLNRFEDTVNFVLDTLSGQRHIPLKISCKVGTEKFRLTPEKVFLLTDLNSADSVEKKVKVEFLTEKSPGNIIVKLENELPVDVKKIQISPNSYMITLTTLPEKLQGLAAGAHKSNITIIPEGMPNDAPISLPISLFIHE